MAVVDADGHVEESTAMFNFMEKDYFARRPLPLAFDENTVYGIENAIWLIDGKAYPRVVGKGGVRFATPTLMKRAALKRVSIPAQELTDVEARIADLNRMGIEKQVVYPTLFLATTTDDLALEAALLRAYNNFMADACRKSADRIRFAALVPIRNIDESIKEIRRAKSLGAVSVMLLGVAWDKSLGHESLYPFYEEASRLELPVCIHFGWGSPEITAVFEASESFNAAVLPVLMGCHSVISSGVLDVIPRLRFAFLETGSFWVPYLIHQLKRNRRARFRKDPADYFREGRVYIACEVDEDINYLTRLIGEDCLVVASDYPHEDPSSEANLASAVMGRDDVPLRVREKILSENPKGLYGI